jgi:arylsulfatase A-like enzyme
MLPALLGARRSGPRRAPVIHHSSAAMYAIRDGDWKLMEGLGSGGFTKPARIEPEPGGPQGQLYNLREDPREERNLWSERPAEAQRLLARLNAIRAAAGSRPGAA